MYELTEWEGMELTLPLQYDTIEIDEEFIKSLSLNIGEENLNLFDVKFAKEVKKADKADYLFSVFSGSLACGLHYLISKDQKINIKFDNKDLLSYVQLISKFYNLSKKDLAKADKDINKFFNKKADDITDLPEEVKIVKDFAKGLSYTALLTSVINSVFGCRIGLDEKGNFVIKSAKLNVKKNATIQEKIVCGICDWLVDEAVAFDKKNKTTDVKMTYLK